MQYHTIKRNTIWYNPLLSNTRKCNAVPYIIIKIIWYNHNTTIGYNAIQYDKVQYLKIQCNIIHYRKISYNPMKYYMIQYHPIPYDELQFNAIPYNAELHHLIPYNAMQYHAKQYYTLQYHAIACHTVEFILTRRIRDSYYCSVNKKNVLTNYPTANTLSNHHFL